MKIMIYVNDNNSETGHYRQMAIIIQHFLKALPYADILVVSGNDTLGTIRSQVSNSNRCNITKLPSLEPFSTSADAIQQRSESILAATINFQPDVLLVDEKPYGINDELKETLAYLQDSLNQTQLILLMKDMLDHPNCIITDWERQGYYHAIRHDYHQVLVMGIQAVWNFSRAYHFSSAMKQKVRFCGYISYPADYRDIPAVRRSLQVFSYQRLVVVVADGSLEGNQIIMTYLQSLALIPQTEQVQTLILRDANTPLQPQALQEITKLIRKVSPRSVIIQDYPKNFIRYLIAADAIVSMGSYEMICQILSVERPAIIIPQIKESQEQLMRTASLKKLGLLKAIHPDYLTPEYLMKLLWKQLHHDPLKSGLRLDMEALPCLSKHLHRIFRNKPRQPRKLVDDSEKSINHSHHYTVVKSTARRVSYLASSSINNRPTTSRTARFLGIAT
jgi:predicted glycosyltransferase